MVMNGWPNAASCKAIGHEIFFYRARRLQHKCFGKHEGKYGLLAEIKLAASIYTVKKH